MCIISCLSCKKWDNTSYAYTISRKIYKNLLSPVTWKSKEVTVITILNHLSLCRLTCVGTGLCALHAETNSVLTMNLWGRYYGPRCSDKETEAWGVLGTCLQVPRQAVEGPGLSRVARLWSTLWIVTLWNVLCTVSLVKLFAFFSVTICMCFSVKI